MQLNPTKNGLAENVRSKDVELLNSRLAVCFDLRTQTKQAHGNDKSPEFIALHKLLDEINDDVEEYGNTIAARAVRLGGFAEGTARDVAAKSSLSEYPLTIMTGRDHVDALANSLSNPRRRAGGTTRV